MYTCVQEVAVPGMKLWNSGYELAAATQAMTTNRLKAQHLRSQLTHH